MLDRCRFVAVLAHITNHIRMQVIIGYFYVDILKHNA